MSAGTVSLTMKRNVPVWPWNGDDLLTPISPGTIISIPLTPGVYHVGKDGYTDHTQLLYGAASVPCDDLDTDSCDCGDGYGCSHGSWYWCRRFSDCENITNICRGDKCRCCSSKVRAEAAASLQEQTQEKGGERS